MQFRNVIGQQEIKHQLLDLVNHNRLGHALLFLSKEGNGGLPMALAFAQYVVCEKVNGKKQSLDSIALFDESARQEQFQPKFLDSCGTCPACVKATKLVHPDIHFSYPVISRKPGEKTISTDYAAEWREFLSFHPYGNAYDWLQSINAENKQGNITAQECNDIIHKLNLKSFESAYKILIMWMPEYLGNEGNRLLKLIEEPPPDTLFIFVAENESLILPTIISRTQLIKIPSLETSQIEDALVERTKINNEQARQIAAICEGNYREALQLLNHAEEDWQELLRQWLNALLKTGPVAQVKWIDEISKQGREKQKRFLLYFNHLLEQSVRLTVLGDNNIRIPGNEKDFCDRLNRAANLSQKQIMVLEIDKAIYYIERNANPRMLFHSLTIKLYHIIANKMLPVVN